MSVNVDMGVCVYVDMHVDVDTCVGVDRNVV